MPGARDSVASAPGEVMPSQRRNDSDKIIAEKSEQGIGKLAGEFPCYFQNAKGVLYAGSEGLFFLGSMFFFERQLNVRWIDVIKVIKGTNGFMLVTPDCNHEFRELAHLDRCWATLVSLHSEALHGGKGRGSDPASPSNPRSMISPLRQTLRRTNSDPLSEIRHAEDEPYEEEDSYMAAASIANMKEAREHFSTRTLPPYKSMRLPPSQMNPLVEEGDDFVEDLEDAWAQLQTPSDEGYSDCAVKDHEISCDLQTFYTLFISDNAEHSFPKFQESTGDRDLVTSEWEPEKAGSPVLTRTIQYSHPVNAPLAPPLARAKKEQRFRRYGDHGISIETDTYVEDVPMADCFYVTDRIMVEPRGEKKVVVLVEFDIRFVKSTMFRSVIANTTRSEFMKSFKLLFEFMAEIAEGGKPPDTLAKVAVPAVVPTPEPSPLRLGSGAFASIAPLYVLLLAVLWMEMQNRSMINSLLIMQQEMMQECPAMTDQ